MEPVLWPEELDDGPIRPRRKSVLERLVLWAGYRMVKRSSRLRLSAGRKRSAPVLQDVTGSAFFGGHWLGSAH
jgi:hypothetical protein